MSEQPIVITKHIDALIIIYKNRIWSIVINTNDKPYRPYVSCRNLTNKECYISRTIGLPREFDKDLLTLGNKMMINKYLLAWDHYHIVIMDIDDIIYGENPVVNSKAYDVPRSFNTIGVLYNEEGAIVEDVIQTGPNAIAIGLTCLDRSSYKKFARIVFMDIENGKIIHTDKSIPDIDVKKLVVCGDKVMALCAKPDNKTSKCDDLKSYNHFEFYVVDPATALVVSKKKLDDE